MIIIFLAIIGGMTIVAAIACAVGEFINWYNDYTRWKIYEYEREHRFDGPPTAECYCIDCRHGLLRDYGAVICDLGKINHEADSWFCADAVPKDKEDLKREKQLYDQD